LKAVRVNEAVKNEVLEELAYATAIGAALFTEASNWSAAQWLSLPADARRAWVAQDATAF